ncbi:MAG: ABC transporter permease, partial [Planctomycetes bacterium]|nr:ABC transporter permease [Planctomycetota bacterium]
MRSLLRNPVLRYELSRMAHRKRTFFGRTFLLLIAAAAALIAIMAANAAMLSAQEPAEVIAGMGVGIFYTLVVTAWIVIVFVVPGFASSLFAREKERQTLPVLLVTDLSDLEIVQAKVMAGLAAAGLAVLGFVPVVFLCLIFGGVSWLDVIGQFSILLGLLCFCCGVGVYCSATCANASIASGRATGLCLLAVIWPPILLVATQMIDFICGGLGNMPITPTLVSLIAFIQPLFGAISVGNISSGGGFVPGWVAQHAWISASLVCVAWFILFCRLAARRIADREAVLRVTKRKPRSLSLSFSSFRKPSDKGPSDRPTEHVWDNPIMWHAWRSTTGVSRWWIGAFLCLFMVAIPFGGFCLSQGSTVLFFESIYHWTIIMVEMMIVATVLAGRGAESIAPEREKRTLPFLLLTDLTPLEIVGGKARGILLRAWWLLLLPLIHAGLIALFRLVGWITPLLLFL